MKKNNSLVEAFTDANKQLCKSRPAVEPRDIYLAYCALALCTIADKMAADPYLMRGEENHDKLS